MDAEFSIETAWEVVRRDLPFRHDEVRESILRGIKNSDIVVVSGDAANIDSAVIKLSPGLSAKLKSQGTKILDFLNEATCDLLADYCSGESNIEEKNCLLDCLSKLMARYGYAYAGQIAGVLKADEFVPRDALKEICEASLREHNTPELTVDAMMDAIGFLFDRRDPLLNQLAFSLCQKYYYSRLIGLDMPIDFLSDCIYRDSIIYLDTNFMFSAVLSKSTRHNEFREILKSARSLGITFAVSELTIAESLERVSEYRQVLEDGQELVPPKLLGEAEEDMLTSASVSGKGQKERALDSRTARRLKDMNVDIADLGSVNSLPAGEELDRIRSELHEYDLRYRGRANQKDDDALYHDAQLYHMVMDHRRITGRATCAWFLTIDNSLIAYGIDKKAEGAPPYSIKLPIFLHTLSPFVEVQTLRLEFEELFAELVAKDLLPKEDLFTIDDLKMFVNFDIKAKAIPPEFVRKGMQHIKKIILRDGGLTDGNKAEIVYELTKYISSPEEHFVELQRRYDSRLLASEEEIKKRDLDIDILKEGSAKKNGIIERLEADLGREKERTETKEVAVKKLRIGHDQEKKAKEKRNGAIVILVGLFLTIILWIEYSSFSDAVSDVADRPSALAIAIQLMLVFVVGTILFQNRRSIVAICTGIAWVASLIAGFV